MLTLPHPEKCCPPPRQRCEQPAASSLKAPSTMPQADRALAARAPAWESQAAHGRRRFQGGCQSYLKPSHLLSSQVCSHSVFFQGLPAMLTERLGAGALQAASVLLSRRSSQRRPLTTGTVPTEKPPHQDCRPKPDSSRTTRDQPCCSQNECCKS